MGWLTRSMRAHDTRTGGFHWCGACQGGTRQVTVRTWGKGGWSTATAAAGSCPACSGRGGRFQNHEAIGSGAMRRMR